MASAIASAATLDNRSDKLPEVSSAELKRMGSEYQARRITLRNDLLRLQDELRAELTAEEWDDVIDALNTKAKSVSREIKEG